MLSRLCCAALLIGQCAAASPVRQGYVHSVAGLPIGPSVAVSFEPGSPGQKTSKATPRNLVRDWNPVSLIVPTAFPTASANLVLNVTGVNFDKDNETYPGSVPVYSLWRCLSKGAGPNSFRNHEVKANSEPCTCSTPTLNEMTFNGVPVVGAVDLDTIPANSFFRVPAVKPTGVGANDYFTHANEGDEGLTREVTLQPPGQQTNGQITITAADIQNFQRYLGFHQAAAAALWTPIKFDRAGQTERSTGVDATPQTAGQEADILLCLQSEPRESVGAGLVTPNRVAILDSVSNSLGSTEGGSRQQQSQATQDGSAEGGTQRGSLLLRFRQQCSLSDEDFCARRAADATQATQDRSFTLDPQAARWAHTCAAPELLGSALASTAGSGVCINAGVEEFCGLQIYDRRYAKCCSSDRSLNALVLPNDVTRTSTGTGDAATTWAKQTTDEGGQVDRFPCPCSAPASDLGHPISCGRVHEGVPERCCTYTKHGAENAAAANANVDAVLRPQVRLFAESGLGVNPHIPASFSTDGNRHVRGAGGDPGGKAKGLDADGDAFGIGNSQYPYYFCYNPQYQQCCDDGTIYDPGTAQCCAITGVQSIREACPCMNDDHCKTPNDASSPSKSCCMQTTPTLPVTGFEEVMCSTYANRWVDPIFQNANSMAVNTALNRGDNHGYAGWHPADPRRDYNLKDDQFPRGPNVCPGRCIDNSFQVCCNGAVCRGEYERCCNDTCCNKYSASCITASHSASHMAGMRTFWNTYDYGLQFDTCSEIEHLDMIKAFFIFVVPFFCSVATFIGILALSYKAASSISDWSSTLQVVIVFVSIFEVISVGILFWSPDWKYALVTGFVAYFTVQAVLADSRSVYIIAFFLQIFLWLYLVNPFDGNLYFNLAAARGPFRGDGVWDATWSDNEPIAGQPEGGDTLPFVRASKSHTLAGRAGYDAIMAPPDVANTEGRDGRWSSAWNRQSSGYTWGRKEQDKCSAYYHYFTYDPRLMDTDRTADPARRHFGLCSDEWLFVKQLCVSFTKILVTLGVGLLAGIAFSRVENDKQERAEYEAIESEDQPINTGN